MIPLLDETHDPGLRSWVEPANAAGAEFPIQSLPYGVFRAGGAGAPRVGVAIGDRVLDVAGCAGDGLLAGAAAAAASACGAGVLNPLMALGRSHWSALRRALSALLGEAAPRDLRARAARHLLPLADAELQPPAAVGDYTDFYASLHHASNVGRLFRPDNPLLPNYKHVPIGYHGRASSLVVSGTPVRRPLGQQAGEGAPRFGPSQRLDYELELGLWVGPGNLLGEPIPIDAAQDHLFGVCLLNDWSARDIQAWEYQPLGPFLAKSFATSISPWVVTMDALAPFRVPACRRPEGDPAPLPYLDSADDRGHGGLALTLEVWLCSERMRAEGLPPLRLCRSDFREMYWTAAQLLTHHASNGCNLRPGDLLGSGTVSGPEPDARGCLLEQTAGGREPLRLPSGEQRRFLADGDEVVLRGAAERDGFARISLGECRGRVLPALPAL